MSELDIQIGVSLEVPDIEISVESSSGGIPYDGDYEVTPALYASQALQTAGRVMRRDVTIYAIPMTEVSNPQGGLTVLIG